MDTLIHDLDQAVSKTFTSLSGAHSASDVLYDLKFADDVVLISKSRAVMQFLLENIQDITETSGMHLNKCKTALIVMNPAYANKQQQFLNSFVNTTISYSTNNCSVTTATTTTTTTSTTTLLPCSLQAPSQRLKHTLWTQSQVASLLLHFKHQQN